MKLGIYTLNKAHQGKVLTVLRNLPDACIDVIFIDPPFNVGKPYKGSSDSRSNHDYRWWCAAWMAECFRVLKSTGTFYVMTITEHLEWKMPIMASHGTFVSLISWRNVSAARSPRAFWHEYQPMRRVHNNGNNLLCRMFRL